MPKRKDPEARIAEIEAELARKKAELSREKAKLAERKRKDETRRKIIAGAIALEHAELDPAWGATLWRVLDKTLERPDDRALLGLAPRPANDGESGDPPSAADGTEGGEGDAPEAGSLRPPFSQAG